MDAAIAHSAGQNLKVSAALVDAGGNPICVFVLDGVSARTGDIAIRKGVTTLERTVHFPGGVPLKAGDTIVGFIAASGAMGAQDEVCTKAGADKIAARIKQIRQKPPLWTVWPAWPI